MNGATSKRFADGYLSGFFDMVATMLSTEANHVTKSVSAIPPTKLAELEATAQFAALVRASVRSGGGVGVLFPAQDICKIAATAAGEKPQEKTSLSQEDLTRLKEVFAPCVGAGASYFKEKFGQAIDLDEVQVLACDKDTIDSFRALLGDSAVQAVFSYSVGPDMRGEGILVYSAQLEQVVPSDAREAATRKGDRTLKATPTNLNGPPEHGEPFNLGMVLDIRLAVKARLGRVEMSLHDILELGPGSIIEVGHLVEEPIELLVNDKLIARGDVVVVDEKFGLRITEIVSPRERIESLR